MAPELVHRCPGKKDHVIKETKHGNARQFDSVYLIGMKHLGDEQEAEKRDPKPGEHLTEVADQNGEPLGLLQPESVIRGG